MGDLSVDGDALRQFATGSSNRRQEIDEIRGRMAGVQLPRNSFGYIPGIGNRVYAAYQEFASGCADSIASAAETMDSIAAAMRDVADGYQTTDQAAGDGVTAAGTGLGRRAF